MFLGRGDDGRVESGVPRWRAGPWKAGPHSEEQKGLALGRSAKAFKGWRGDVEGRPSGVRLERIPLFRISRGDLDVSVAPAGGEGRGRKEEGRSRSGARRPQRSRSPRERVLL